MVRSNRVRKGASQGEGRQNEKAPTVAPVEAWNDEKLLELFQNDSEIANAISIIIQCQRFMEAYDKQAKIFQKICKQREPTQWELAFIEEKSLLAIWMDHQSGYPPVHAFWDDFFPVGKRKFKRRSAAVLELARKALERRKQETVRGP